MTEWPEWQVTMMCTAVVNQPDWDPDRHPTNPDGGQDWPTSCIPSPAGPAWLSPGEVGQPDPTHTWIHVMGL